ncbi:hypothetical protein G9A89_013829 [Geosiphon pyriformis]|nr:hypothetical protein G9A89_013829 [Geosiphon pyriformis]
MLVYLLARFGQAADINSMVSKAVNSSSFVVLGSNFNENGSSKSASFKFCLGLGLFNTFDRHLLAKASTWSNSRDVKKVIDFILVNGNLASAITSHFVDNMFKFFDTNHKSVSISIGLGGLLDTHLINIYRQANQDWWRFKLKNVDNVQWLSFKDCSFAKFLARSNMFKEARYSEYDCLRNKQSSIFFKLELLVAKVVKCWNSGDLLNFNCLIKIWLAINVVEASKVDSMVLNSVSSMELIKHLSMIKKEYCKSKYYESKIAKDTAIKKAIDYCIENFCFNKGKMIKSILKRPFCKMVLDYLVVNDELVVEPNKMKLKVDKIMEELSGILNKLWKHCGGEILVCLLKLLNLCLNIDIVPNLWKKAWVSMIPKPYEWNSILTNTRPIILVETVCKILSKILSDRISLACSKFNVLCGDNFLVLKSTLTQSPIFAIGSVIENALKKNREFWLHYLRVNLHHIKMSECFIQFFGNIHGDWLNRVMTDFGFLDGYRIHNRLDQEEVFSPLLWRIFYDLLLCKVKRHKQLCGYRINSKFVAKSGRIETSGGKTFFLAAGAFASMQYILNIASEFFVINDISINNNKTSESYRYLDIFLSTESFSNSSLAQVHKDVKFFSNIVLKKAIINKQFCYLVSAVLQSIVSYCVQFSFITLNVCHKWNIMIRKSLRAKAGLPYNFPSKVLYHPSLYRLKPFNIFRHLFDHKFLDLQILGWSPLNSLQFSVKLHVNPVNNFLAGVVKIFLENELSLANNLPCVFHGFGNFSMSGILGQSLYYKSVFLLKCFGVAFGDRILNKKKKVIDWKTFQHWKQLNPRGPVSYWFFLTSDFMNDYISLGVRAATATEKNVLSVLDSDRFSKMYIDRSLRCTGSVGVVDGTAVYFLTANMSIGVKVAGLLSSTLAELQAVVLALECVLSSYSVVLYSDSQSAIDACISEASLTIPDFYNQYLYQLICCAHWKTGPDFGIVLNVIIKEIDWDATAMVWHPDSHMFSEFTSRKSANLCTYLMKTVYRWLPVVVKKRLYNGSYSGVLCLLCGEVEFSDHVFACFGNSGLHGNILVEAAEKWMLMFGLTSLFLSAILLSLLSCSLDVDLYTAVYKGFVMKDWYVKAISVFEGRKKATQILVEFIRFVIELQCTRI